MEDDELRKLGRTASKAKARERASRKQRGATMQPREFEYDGFHPKVLPDASKRNERRNCGILREGRAVWEMAAASWHDDVLFFFLSPKKRHERTSIALLSTLIRWWEWLRAIEVSRWQERHRVGCDATAGCNGGAERTAWRTLDGNFDCGTGAMEL